jgi:hypothetical protein
MKKYQYQKVNVGIESSNNFLQRCADYINQTFEVERMRIKQISMQASSDNYIALI